MREIIASALPNKLYLLARWYDFRIFRPTYFSEIQKLRQTVTTTGTSYKSFDDTRSIFVHIPKCAGISVSQALYGNIGGGHTSLDQYINVFEPQKFEDYFKFCFVRNPWDRLVSAYFFLKSGGFNSWDEIFFNQELSRFHDFNDFVLRWVNPENVMKYYHFMPQYIFIVDKFFKVSVDYICYFENIDSDFEFICNKIGVPASLKKSNTGHREQFHKYYTATTKKIVANTYKIDVELFNYNFTNSNGFVRNIDPKTIKKALQDSSHKIV